MLAAAWQTLFWRCLADCAVLAFGSLVAGIVLGIDISSAFVYGLCLAVIAMPVAALAGTAYDALRPRSATAEAPGGRNTSQKLSTWTASGSQRGR